MPECRHERVTYGTSKAASTANYQPRTWKTLKTAEGVTAATNTKRSAAHLAKYPGPLVLPDDDLFYEPDYDPQPLSEWRELWDDNYAEPDRRKIYVVPPPRIGKGAAFMRDWSDGRTSTKAEAAIPRPSAKDVCSYLEAFYDGLEIKLLPASTLTWSLWEPGTKDIALQTSTEAIQIRSRESCDGLAGRQLDLNDILDAAISMLPKDALALVLLVDHDLYEDVNDDFVCGRAFGGSHVCVVSSARYHPGLDKVQNVDRVHSWPASHCADFVERACRGHTEGKGAIATDVRGSETRSSPLVAAMEVHREMRLSTTKELASLWLWRFCRTASHEIGHCLGIDHCVYYACIMQSTASMAEDVRQPPYLCPVEEAKLRAIIASRSKAGPGKGMAQREESMLQFCRSQGTGSAFDAYRQWLESALGH